MPGISGLETLSRIKAINKDIPVVMITKNEEENIMEEAIGSQIADYLIKPVKPNQILLAIKKITENKKLISEKTATSYRQEFQNIMTEVNNVNSHQEWAELYKKINLLGIRIGKSRQSGYEEYSGYAEIRSQ
jgi:DNA-binding NarL/FixJ family response regulator